MQPPRAPREPQSRIVHGHAVLDDYAWMADRDDPRLRAYLEAENAYAAERTGHLDPLVERIVGELKSRTVETDLSAARLLYTSPSPRDRTRCRMPSSA